MPSETAASHTESHPSNSSPASANVRSKCHWAFSAISSTVSVLSRSPRMPSTVSSAAATSRFRKEMQSLMATRMELRAAASVEGDRSKMDSHSGMEGAILYWYAFLTPSSALVPSRMGKASAPICAAAWGSASFSCRPEVSSQQHAL